MTEPTNANQSKTEPLLSTAGLTKVYADGQVNALRDVSIEIGQGEYVAIMGPSGSGKSTLLNLLGGLDRPSSGEVYFQGRRLSELPNLDRYRSHHVGFVFQSFHLMSTLRAVENVQLPMFGSGRSPAVRAEKARELLSLVGLAHREMHRPDQLSVGERQRVAIARALGNDPEVLFGDEPTGNLDSRTAAEILDLFDRLHAEGQLTLILVTHSEKLAARAHRVIRLEDGGVVEG